MQRLYQTYEDCQRIQREVQSLIERLLEKFRQTYLQLISNHPASLAAFCASQAQRTARRLH